MNPVDVFCTESRDSSPMRLSFPSCEELGIPLHSDDFDTVLFPGRIPRGFSFKLQPAKTASKADPFSPYSMIPLPSPFLIDSTIEPTFIRKRNERERERVRCVNDGYTRLKEHIPLENKDKRVSKVEILRTAISYIKHLQTLLDNDKKEDCTELENIEIENIESVEKAVSVSSDDSDSQDASLDSEPPTKRQKH